MARRGARESMIDAAEEIVATSGLTALNLRDVQRAAGQANKSAAQYHFGSRNGLLEAVLERRMGPVNDRRREMLEALGEHPEPGDLIESLVLPLAAETVRRPGSCYARFLAQAIFAPELTDLIDKHLRAESFREVWRRLVACSPLPRQLVEKRVSSVVLLVLATLAAREPQHRSRTETDLIVADLVAICLAVFEAPVPTPIEGD